MDRPVGGAEQRRAVQRQIPGGARERAELAVELSAPLRLVGDRPETREDECRDSVG